MNKIIFSLLLISIAFVAMGAAAASDGHGSHRHQLAVSDNVVSDLEGPNIISSTSDNLEKPSIISSDLEGPNIISLEKPSIIHSTSDRPGYDVSLNGYPAVDLGDTPICIYKGSSIGGGWGPDFGPHLPVDFDIHDHPINPIGPKGPILQ